MFRCSGYECFIISLSNSVLWRCSCSIIINCTIWQHSLEQHLLSEIKKLSYHLQKHYQLHYFSHFRLLIQYLQHEANYRLLQNELLLLYIVFLQAVYTCHHKFHFIPLIVHLYCYICNTGLVQLYTTKHHNTYTSQTVTIINQLSI
jgi:hypothetical protein